MAGGGRRGKGEGSIYRRRDGQWAGSLDMGPEGGIRKRIVLYGKTQSEVREKLREAQRAYENGVLHSGRLTIGQWLTYWLEVMLPGTVAEGTLDVYRNIVRLHLVPSIGAVRLTRLTPADVSRLLSALERKGYAAETRRAIRAVLRRALRMAEQQGLLSRNVAAIADGPKIPRREGRTLTPEQARQFLRAVEGHRLEAAYVTTLSLGLRRGEVLGLFWGDLDLDSEPPVVQIRRQLIRRHLGLTLSDLKTTGSRRMLFLSAPLVQLLREHRARQVVEQEKAGELWRDDGDLVFRNPLGRPLDVDAFGQSVPRICKAAGLGHWSIHELRHSCASLMLAMEVPLEVVSDTLGHSSIRVTKDVYGHLLAASKMKAAEAMRKTLWLEELPDFQPLATGLATGSDDAETDNASTRPQVRPSGFEPETCGLRVRCSAVELEAHRRV